MTAICKCKTSKQIKWKVVVFPRRDINYRSFDSNLKISIIKNDARCISAELERDLYESNNARSMLSTSFWISQAQKQLGGYTSYTVPVSSGWVGYGQINCGFTSYIPRPTAVISGFSYCPWRIASTQISILDQQRKAS